MYCIFIMIRTLWKHSQKHICSLLLNKCHDCMKIKIMKEGDWEETPRAVGTTIKRTAAERKTVKTNVIINYAPGPG